MTLVTLNVTTTFVHPICLYTKSPFADTGLELRVESSSVLRMLKRPDSYVQEATPLWVALILFVYRLVKYRPTHLLGLQREYYYDMPRESGTP